MLLIANWAVQCILFQASVWQLLACSYTSVIQGCEFSEDLRSRCVLDREDSSWLSCVSCVD